ncbi:M48 family metallopeptidase [Palleronia sp. KMU-117]|uniref:M48 family metallopeptidase n=1 Tax=Palleronia sp. KMU-117 TaxID=3434108 RepID=UPI003D719DB1
MLFRKATASILLVAATAACTVTVAPPAPVSTGPTPTSPSQTTSQAAAPRPTPVPVASSRSPAAARLAAVAARVEPVAEQECFRRTNGAKCNLTILIDEDPRKQANAFQTLDRAGNPIIVFNVALVQAARNGDELAFVLGHEAAHHILGHIPQTQQTAVLGAVVAGALAQAGGFNGDGVALAQDLGATVGSRAFSKDYELQADQLGTVITARSGFDPLRGAEFFARIPDPGDRFLGSHPPNAQRIEVVRQTAAGL